jgi:hypothetical protein
MEYPKICLWIIVFVSFDGHRFGVYPIFRHTHIRYMDRCGIYILYIQLYHIIPCFALVDILWISPMFNITRTRLPAGRRNVSNTWPPQNIMYYIHTWNHMITRKHVCICCRNNHRFWTAQGSPCFQKLMLIHQGTLWMMGRRTMRFRTPGAAFLMIHSGWVGVSGYNHCNNFHHVGMWLVIWPL